MFDAKASQPDVEIDLIIWLNLRIRMMAELTDQDDRYPNFLAA